MSSFRRRLMMIQSNQKTYGNGVYIAYSDGTLKTVEEGDSTNDVGVAVISDNCSFIIDKANDSPNNQRWSNQDKDLSLKNFTTEQSAKTDYNGKSNTDIIEDEDSENEAAAYCR